MKNMTTFSMEIPVNDPKAMEEFQKLIDQIHDETDKYIEEVTEELNISSQCANDVVYLRTRSRWTQELEDELIRLYKEGITVNVNEFWN